MLVDENKWTSLDEYELAAIRKTLSENYIELDTTPAINAYIDYGSNLGHSDQMSLDELHQLDSIITHGNLIEGMIHDTVAFISKVSINTDEYLKYLFGDHYVVYKQKKRKQEVPKLIEVLSIKINILPGKQFKSIKILVCYVSSMFLFLRFITSLH